MKTSRDMLRMLIMTLNHLLPLQKPKEPLGLKIKKQLVRLIKRKKVRRCNRSSMSTSGLLCTFAHAHDVLFLCAGITYGYREVAWLFSGS